jgi:hypothetical protein
MLVAGFEGSDGLAPFYSLPPALGKRAGMALLQEGRRIPGHFVGRPRSGQGG